MNLQIVTGTPFMSSCLKCGRRMLLGDGTLAYADLDGEPFKAYYCRMCITLAPKCAVEIKTTQRGMYRYLAHTGELFDGGKHFAFSGAWVLPMYEDEIRAFVAL